MKKAQNLTSFLAGAEESQFPLENIPFGVAARKQSSNDKFAATRIGGWVINLKEMENNGLFSGNLLTTVGKKVFQGEYLNDFMGLTRDHWKQARASIQQHFASNSPLKDDEELKSRLLIKVEDAVNHLPAQIGDFTDFSSSLSHAHNYGFIRGGPNNALNENWLHLPIGYHGRSSSVVLSGTPVRRAWGQIKQPDSKEPIFTKCRKMDYEVQLGFFIGGKTNELGSPLKINNAEENIFGFVLLNDWSFRDFMMWEFRPLGPFTCKNGITAISPWIVTLDALEGCQITLPDQDPAPLPYLLEKVHKSYNIELSMHYKTPKMEKAQQLVKTNYRYMYWTAAQQLVHHSITGCNMRPGDLIGAGTVSGSQKSQFGSMFELSWGGKNDVVLENGETRRFMEDWDSATIKGCARINGKIIGFGECQGTILPAFEQNVYY